MKHEILTIIGALIGIIITLIIGLTTWYLNERSKRVYEEYKRKEERYSELIRTLKGFYIDSLNKELKDGFLNQLNLCWLYCPDEVINKGYNFLSTVHTNNESKDEERERALGEFILAIRKDLIKREPLEKTNLEAKDFKHLKAT